MVNGYFPELQIVIPSINKVPLFRYDSRHDDEETGFKEYYSLKYLRRQRKLNRRKNMKH